MISTRCEAYTKNVAAKRSATTRSPRNALLTPKRAVYRPTPMNAAENRLSHPVAAPVEALS